MVGFESPLPPFYAPPRFNLENIKKGEIFSWVFWNALYVIVTPVKATLYLGYLAWSKLSGKPISSRQVKPAGVDRKINPNLAHTTGSIGKNSPTGVSNPSPVKPGETVRTVSDAANQQQSQVASYQSSSMVSNQSQHQYVRQKQVQQAEQSDLAQLRIKEINERNYKRAVKKSLKHSERETLKEVLRTSRAEYLAERPTQQRLQKEQEQADLDYQFAQLQAADLIQAGHQLPACHRVQEQGLYGPEVQQTIWESLTKQHSSSIQVSTPKPGAELPPMTISEHIAEEAKRGLNIYFQDGHVIAWLLDKKDVLMKNKQLKEGLDKCACDLSKVSEAEWSQVLSGWKITKNDFHNIYGLTNEMPLRIKLVEKLIAHKVNIEQVHQAQPQQINPGQEKKPTEQFLQPKLQQAKLAQENKQQSRDEPVRITRKVTQVEIGAAEASKLKSEPSDSEHDVFSIHFRIGDRVIARRFWPDDPVQSLLDFLETQGYPSTDFKLVTSYPHRELDRVSLTVRELKLGNKFAVRVVKK